jgi:ribosomal protein L11 methyltransferase
VEALVGEGTSVLDVGCGSGVLAVAAATLGAAPVVAVDVDPVAVAATERAALAAGLSIDARVGGVGAVHGTFDVVLANIGARTLVRDAAALAGRVRRPGGHLVLSGLLVGQVAEVAAAYEARGLATAGGGDLEGWATPVFVGKSTFSGR